MPNVAGAMVWPMKECGVTAGAAPLYP